MVQALALEAQARQQGKPRCDAEAVAVEGAEVGHGVRHQQLHQLGAARERTDGSAVAKRLAADHEVWSEVAGQQVLADRPLQRDAQSGERFVQDEH